MFKIQIQIQAQFIGSFVRWAPFGVPFEIQLIRGLSRLGFGFHRFQIQFQAQIGILVQSIFIPEIERHLL